MDETSEVLPFHPAVAIRLNDDICKEAVEWLIQKICGDKLNDGCQLYVEKSGNLLYVSASDHRFMLGAELLGLKKEYKDGTLRDFSFADGMSFKHFNDENFLLGSECLHIIKHELEGLRAVTDEIVPGHPSIKLYAERPIFRKLRKKLLITDYFPLHNRHELSFLKRSWIQKDTFSLSKPVDAVYEYFGHNVGIYFAFLNFYTIGLIPLVMWTMLLAIIGKIRGAITNLIMALLVSFWSSIVLELWKRSSNEYLYTWGYSDTQDWEEPRPEFRGNLGINHVSGKKEATYSPFKRLLRVWCISFPIVALCIGLSISVMFYYFRWEVHFARLYKGEDLFSQAMQNVPSIVYSVVVIIADVLYRQLAEYLTNKENHKLESTFQNYLIFKILLFVFANNFLCLFYIAFVYDDMEMLKMSMEALIPYWIYTIRSASHRQDLSSTKGFRVSALATTVSINRDQQTLLELSREDYPGTFDDYVELWLQFGYVVLFASVYPEAAVFAFINNMIEQRSDAFKLCCIYRRPFPDFPNVITAWHVAFQALSYLAIVSNLALVFKSSSFDTLLHLIYPDISKAEIITLFFFCEHGFLFFRWVISLLIPDTPEWVRTEMAKIKYWSLEALKRQRSLVLRSTDRFQPSNSSALM